jgi:hypothetical protein
MAPPAVAKPATSARIVKLDTSQNLSQSAKPKKVAKPPAKGDKQKKRKAGQEAAVDEDDDEDDSDGEVVSG